MGTLRYMAPEQLRGQADQRTDVYALGLTLQELLTLQPPGIPLMSAGGQRETVSLRSLRAEVPRDLETIVQKACSAEPERRYQTAADLEADLLRFLEDRPILARPAGLAERVWRWSRRNPQLATLSAATLLLMLSVVVILGVSNRRIQRLLTARDKQYERAEQSLQDKGAALQTADRERQRAEKNLQLAVTAFEEVFANISARGRAEVLLEELGGEESLEDTTAVLSAADVTLLETLLGFFDRLAAENSRNLGLTAAEARRRVGDIQRQLGRLMQNASLHDGRRCLLDVLRCRIGQVPRLCVTTCLQRLLIRLCRILQPPQLSLDITHTPPRLSCRQTQVPRILSRQSIKETQ
ncbi:MAG: hypothetical protein ACKPJJ_01510, partial [Planctomycetaceae bacterium]